MKSTGYIGSIKTKMELSGEVLAYNSSMKFTRNSLSRAGDGT
jgi:hypothetical protein